MRTLSIQLSPKEKSYWSRGENYVSIGKPLRNLPFIIEESLLTVNIEDSICLEVDHLVIKAVKTLAGPHRNFNTCLGWRV